MRKATSLVAVLALAAAASFGVRAYAASPEPLAVGTTAPNFTLPSQEDRPISLSEFKGKWVVLYFYPKDQTQGCTIEAHNFQRDQPKYDAAHAVVLGVSMDTVESHKEWCAKDTFSFKMLADPDHKVVDMYEGAADRKVAARQTFLIDPQGKIVKVWPAVQVANHSEEVLAAIAENKK
jgi:peroxiredoxin Q/BCP